MLDWGVNIRLTIGVNSLIVSLISINHIKINKMKVKHLVLGKKYIYTNFNNEEIKVEYIGIESNGITFYRFNSDDNVPYSLFDFEVVDKIKNI